MASYSAGKAAMVIEPANEASIIYDRGGAVADGTRAALVAAAHAPRRPVLPTLRHPSPLQRERGCQVTKFLCAPQQMLDDATQSGFVEIARRSALYDPRLAARFRRDLVEATGRPAPFSRAERPVTRHGMRVGDITGEECARALSGKQSSREAVRRAQARVAALGSPD
jgi:hypothetical protein